MSLQPRLVIRCCNTLVDTANVRRKELNSVDNDISSKPFLDDQSEENNKDRKQQRSGIVSQRIVGEEDSDSADNDLSSGKRLDEEVEISVDVDEDQLESSIVTQSMIEEEEKLHDEYVEPTVPKENEERTISMEERLDRLKLLLQKSKVYADSLLKVIEEKREAERKRALKKEKLAKKKKNLENTFVKNTNGNLSPSDRKRQGTSSGKRQPTKRAKLAMKIEADGELLRSKLYIPKSSDICTQITEKDGVRYFGDQIVNASQPTLFTGGVLRDYQILGYQWLKVLFTNAVNGILADEMGLGKTIQCIAFICQIVRTGYKGPFLVCAPLSTIANWISEFKTFAPTLPLMLYHGTAAERAILARHIKDLPEDVPCYPIVITSYEVLMKDRPILARHHWEYLIVDEGHRIKNFNCKLVKELKQLNVGTKLLLTGTPLQNNLQELWSLLNFIIPEVFDDLRVFESWFDFGDGKFSGAARFSFDQEEKFLSTLYEILTPFVLRRVKADVKLDLPPKSEVIVYAPYSKKQEQFYQAAVAKTIRNLLKERSSEENDLFGSVLSDVSNGSKVTRSKTADLRVDYEKAKQKRLYHDEDKDINVSLNNIMMLLRKCCNHPYLIEYPLIPCTDIFKVDEELISASGKMMILDRILPKLKERGHKVLIFSQMTKMLDILGDYLRFRNFTSVRLDGSCKIEDRQRDIKEYNSNPDLFVFLISTRAGGLGINLTAADTVIIYDSDWNPQNDLQAQDRCHRIGQTRPVMIYRFVTASSIDQRMVERAAEKRKLEKMVMHKNKFKGNLDVELKHKMKIGQSEILRMIQSKDFNSVVNSNQAMSDEEVEKILDRSGLIHDEN